MPDDQIIQHARRVILERGMIANKGGVMVPIVMTDEAIADATAYNDLADMHLPTDPTTATNEHLARHHALGIESPKG